MWPEKAPMEFIVDVARSLGFLSRIPVPSRFFEGDDGRMERTSGGFALAGIILSLLPALLLYALGHGHAPLLAATLATGILVLVTGGLHEDGLGDTMDGLGGGRDRERALAIMKDSRIGSYGALALVLSMLARITALATLVTAGSPTLAALAMVATAGASRAAMVWHWRALPAAKPDGVAARVGVPSGRSLRTALATALILALLLLAPFLSLAVVAVAIFAGLFSTWLFTDMIRSRLGGHTGDTIGATQQVFEIVMLSTLALLI